jgi:hypothetical protein
MSGGFGAVPQSRRIPMITELSGQAPETQRPRQPSR